MKMSEQIRAFKIVQPSIVDPPDYAQACDCCDHEYDWKLLLEEHVQSHGSINSWRGSDPLHSVPSSGEVISYRYGTNKYSFCTNQIKNSLH